MPKQKTKKAALKRIKITGSGKILIGHARTSHLKSKRRAKDKRRKRLLREISSADRARIKRMLPGISFK